MTTPIGHPSSVAHDCHGWGWYTFGPTYDTRRRFYAVRGSDALGLAVQHFGIDPHGLFYYAYNY